MILASTDCYFGHLIRVANIVLPPAQHLMECLGGLDPHPQHLPDCLGGSRPPTQDCGWGKMGTPPLGATLRCYLVFTVRDKQLRPAFSSAVGYRTAVLTMAP